jgi:ligand-binding sensor domain-containing protein
MPPVGSTETAVPSPPPTWTTYTNGNDVNDLAFDKAGNLWAATSGGLVKWMMGGTYIKYTTLDGLPDNDIQDVATAPDGTVWLGSLDGGLIHFDGEGWRTYTAADGLPDSRVWDVAVASDGTVWISTYDSGVTHLTPSTDSSRGEADWQTYTSADGLPSDDAYGIAVSESGAVWIYTASGVARFDGKRWRAFTAADGLREEYAISIAAGPGDTAWVGTNNGVFYFDGATWTGRTEEDGPTSNAVSSIALAPDGTAWLGTNTSGLFRFDGRTWTAYTERDGLPGSSVDNVALAPDGSVWISTSTWYKKASFWSGQGISYFDDKSWTTYTTEDELAANRVDHTVKTADGMLWFFTEGGPSCHNGEDWVPCPGIEQGAPIGPSVTQAPDGALWSLKLSGIIRFDPGAATSPSDDPWIVYDDFPGSSLGNLTIAPDGSVWVSTHMYPARAVPQGYGVAHFDGTSWQVYTATHGLAGDFVNDIAIATDGAVWFGARGGATRFDGETWTTYDINTILPVDDQPYNEIQRIITTPGGLICCEIIGAVSCFDGKSWTAYTEADGLYPEHDSLQGGIHIILSTAVDQDGALWLGTNDGGISRLDGESWTTYTVKDGLGHNQVNTIAVAPDGAVWAGTLNGTSRFDGETWTTYTITNGLVDNIVKNIVVTPDGALWFSTHSGISRYGPSN